MRRSKIAALLVFIVCPVTALADQAADEAAVRTIVSDQST